MKNIDNYPRFGSITLDQNIDEDKAKSTAQMRSYKFNAEEIWPEEDNTAEGQAEIQKTTTSTPIKPITVSSEVMSIPLYKRLIEDNSFNSTLDDDLF